MSQAFVAKVKRGLKKPPRVILKRVQHEASSYIERYTAPRRAKRLDLRALLSKVGCGTLQKLWANLSDRPFCAHIAQSNLEKVPLLERESILARADMALAHRVNLLGSGDISLGDNIHWQKDYKSGHDWPCHYAKAIDYNNPERNSDVKFPWEVSRMQWLIPVGQAFLLTGHERYAKAAKDILDSWIAANPYAEGVNWACTMEVALRILSWSWFFHVFNQSASWQDEGFQARFLTALYLHGDYTERNLELSDINGNHYTADAAGLVFAGLFWGRGKAATRWHEKGWKILCDELPKQVFSDGVDFEASVPYHRLVLELFFLPAVYRQCFKLDIPAFYRERVIQMAHFTAAYIQPQGEVPFWGDADDARALPFGYQAINDHRYSVNLIGYFFKEEGLSLDVPEAQSEVFWLFGYDGLEWLKQQQTTIAKQSIAFPEGGFYIMQNARDHVFIDCGPLGLGGRGGHGHNDCLAFEAVLNGVKLITDCGAYVYTASYNDRNAFRATAAHNTPCVDDEELNRFIQWDYLWNLHEDAKPQVELWQPGTKQDVFIGSHTGYERLTDAVIPKRKISLCHVTHSLTIEDNFFCTGQHQVSIPLHLSPGTECVIQENSILLKAEEKKFEIVWESQGEWCVTLSSSRVSPSYGVVVDAKKLIWTNQIYGNSQLTLYIFPRVS